MCMGDRAEGTIAINLLGGFSISVEGWGQGWKRVETGRRSSRLWSIIAYLAINRTGDTPAERLIEIFWPDTDSGDPLRAVWLAVSRCRTALKELGVSEARSLILSENGGYRWNPNRPTVVDVEEFERLATEKGSGELSRLLAAIDLYQGDFWAQAAGGTWAITRQIYYKSLFLQLCQQAVSQLWEAERWEDVANICRRAVVEEPGEESFSVYFMRALTAMGQPQKALEHYEYIKNILKNEYMVNLSEELELARSEAARKNLGERLDAETVAGYLKTPPEHAAFSCDYPVFRRIVELEVRAARRSGEQAQVVLLDLLPTEKGSGVTTDMKRMERTLSGTLRAGDPFTRLSTTQFLILLPKAKRESVDTVMLRVENAFRKANSHSRARMRYHTIPVESLLESGQQEA